MPKVTSRDGVRIHVEEAGRGTPVLFIHEFGGDHRSWEPQLRYFSRSHRCITFGARGFPPSEVPDRPEAYSQDHAIADAEAVLGGLEIERAHVVGLSMGGFNALHLARLYPQRVISVAAAAVGFGVQRDRRELVHDQESRYAELFETQGAGAMAANAAGSPIHVQFRDKDPRGHAEWAARFAEHSAVGSALTIRGVQMRRPSLLEFEADFRSLKVPALVMCGDEDVECVETSIWLKRTIPTAGLAVLPMSGHTLNLEEPALFNELLADLFVRAEAGTWPLRDPRLITATAADVLI